MAAQVQATAPAAIPTDRAAYGQKISFLILATAGLCELTAPLGDDELTRLVRRSHGRLLDLLIQHRRVSGGPQ